MKFTSIFLPTSGSIFDLSKVQEKNAETFTSPRILLQNTNTTKRDIFFWFEILNYSANICIYFKLSKFS